MKFGQNFTITRDVLFGSCHRVHVLPTHVELKMNVCFSIDFEPTEKAATVSDCVRQTAHGAHTTNRQSVHYTYGCVSCASPRDKDMSPVLRGFDWGCSIQQRFVIVQLKNTYPLLLIQL